MSRSIDRRRRGLASLWPRWFWRPAKAAQRPDHLDEYLQLLDYLDDLSQDEAIERVDVSTAYLPLLDGGSADRIRRRQRRVTARGLQVTFSPDVPRQIAHLHTKRRH